MTKWNFCQMYKFGLAVKKKNPKPSNIQSILIICKSIFENFPTSENLFVIPKSKLTIFVQSFTDIHEKFEWPNVYILKWGRTKHSAFFQLSYCKQVPFSQST